jgi:hypothetical protein
MGINSFQSYYGKGNNLRNFHRSRIFFFSDSLMFSISLYTASALKEIMQLDGLQRRNRTLCEKYY